MAKQTVLQFPEIPDAFDINPSKTAISKLRKEMAEFLLSASGDVKKQFIHYTKEVKYCITKSFYKMLFFYSVNIIFSSIIDSFDEVCVLCGLYQLPQSKKTVNTAIDWVNGLYCIM